MCLSALESRALGLTQAHFLLACWPVPSRPTPPITRSQTATNNSKPTVWTKFAILGPILLKPHSCPHLSNIAHSIQFHKKCRLPTTQKKKMKCFSSFLFRNQNLCLQKKRDGPSPLSIIVNWCPNIRLSIRPLSVGKIVPLFIIVTSCPRPSIRVRLYQRTGWDQVGPVHAFWSENSKNISWPSLLSFAYMAGWVNWSHPKIACFSRVLCPLSECCLPPPHARDQGDKKHV